MITVAFSLSACPCRLTGGLTEGENLSGAIERDSDGTEQALVAGEAVDSHAFADLGSKAQAGDKVLTAQLHTYHLSIVGLDGQCAVLIRADRAVNGACSSDIRLWLGDTRATSVRTGIHPQGDIAGRTFHPSC